MNETQVDHMALSPVGRTLTETAGRGAPHGRDVAYMESGWGSKAEPHTQSHTVGAQ